MAADSYLAMALELLGRADAETDQQKQEGLRALAESYRRMAERAGKYRDADSASHGGTRKA